MKSHWAQIHNPNRKIVDRSGSNNPNFGRKGRNHYTNIDWATVAYEELGHHSRRKRLLKEANYACTAPGCGYNKTRSDGVSILEIDHIDGNHLNNRRDNLRILCPNCHALTPNFRNHGRKGHKKSSTRIRPENKDYMTRHSVKLP